MTRDPHAITSATELRRLFDRSFAEPAVRADARTVDLMLVTVGGRPWALRITDVSGLLADRAPLWLPTSMPGLLGLVTVRQTLVPVYDLRVVMDLPGAAGPLPWIAVVGENRLGLAFDEYRGHVRIPQEAVIPIGDGGQGGFAGGIVHVDGIARSLVAVAAVVDRIETGCRTHKER